uniref:SR-related CTD-associated factor 4a n=1 Tax=Oreochromis aureus TaxID=47969 RepID=A0AAZ1Y0G9_OREAU
MIIFSMISITKSAIKAMKLYKHVVQIVEKFIKKCKPEYKVAGLYVVDSIVRQSRHQFGPDKDVFGPRFTKNITGTFENLCLCPVEDRSKIVRVLNLWQKNGVFKIEVIQPLLDMAAGSGSGAAPNTGSPPPPAKEPVTVVTANSTMIPAAQLHNSDAFAAVAQLFQSSQGQQVFCSTTLWVGQLDKRTQQQDVACLLEEFGQIESINMIPPRGCAYIVMIHRQDAFRALQKLSRGTFKVNQKAIKIAWALNKGIKADYKQYWDVELGVTYVPWSKVREDQLEELKEGGMLDVPPMQQPMVGVGSLQPPVFPGPIGMPPPSFPPGVPPPPFIRPGFNPMQMPPGLPPGAPPGGPLGAPPGGHLGVPPGGPPGAPSGGPPGAPLVGPPAGHPGSIPPPSGGLLGARPGLIPLQRPPVPPPTHMQRFPPPHGSRPPHPGMPPMPPQMMPRGPHPQMMQHHEPPPPKGAFGMPPPHNLRAPFPHGHGPPPQGPPPFTRPGGPRSLEGPEEMDSRPFRGDRPGFRDRELERDRDWDRDRERDRERGFGGGRRPFGDGGRGAGGDKMDGRDRLGGCDRERARGEDGDRERARGEGTERGSRERGRGAEAKGDRPRRSERRERTTRWDKDDRLAELENMDRFRTPNSTEQPCVTPEVTKETSKEPGVEASEKKPESELIAPPPEGTASTGDAAPSEPAQSEPTETNEEAAS